MKIGDKVRFLNETGGGHVAGFQGKNIVMVEDEDGFQVPMLMSEVVVVGDENYDTRTPQQFLTPQAKRPNSGNDNTGGQKANAKNGDDEDDVNVAMRHTFIEERQGGEKLSAYLAFVPVDAKQLSHTRFECYFINDCNYFLRFTFMTRSNASWILHSSGEVAPNTKMRIKEFGYEDLGDMENVAIQLLAFKRNKPFMYKPAIDVQMRIDGVKFYKLHTFQENDFFEEPALLYTIVDNDRIEQQVNIDVEKLRESMYQKKEEPKQETRPLIRKARKEGEPIVVDLHADEVLETTSGMTSADILNYQLDIFRKTLREYEKKKGTRIIFIHGKGEGVLRSALINDLRYRFKSFTYQDASFQEYGYGATQITIK